MGTRIATRLAGDVPRAGSAPAGATQVTTGADASEVSDLTPVADRPATRSIVLQGGTVTLSTDLPHVEELLVLSSFGRFDTSVLARLPNLRTLAVAGTSGPPLLPQLAAHTPLLENLLVRRPLGAGIEPLAGLPELRRVWLHWAKGGVAALNRCPSLQWLHADDGLATGWARLTATAQLRYVRMTPGSLRDLGVVESWPELASLDVGGHGVTSLAGIEHAAALRDLVVRGIGTDDLTPLGALTGLQRIAVSGDARWRPDLSALRRLRSLRFLQVQLGDTDSQGSVPDLGFLPPDAPDLVEAHVPLTVIEDGSLAPLHRYPRLRACRLFGTYGREAARLRAAHPDAYVDVVPDRRRPPVVTVGELSVDRLAGDPPVYSIFQDMRALVGSGTNHGAADRIRAIVAARRPALAEWVEIDSEADGVGLTSRSLEPLVELAHLVTGA